MRDEEEISFVPYNIAQDLKGAGFKEFCYAYYEPKTHLDIEHWEGRNYKFHLRGISSTNLAETNCPAPMWEQALEWLEVKGRLFYNISLSSEGEFNFIIHKVNSINPQKGNFITYSKFAIETYTGEEYLSEEEATIACINQMIKIVKQNL